MDQQNPGSAGLRKLAELRPSLLRAVEQLRARNDRHEAQLSGSERKILAARKAADTTTTTKGGTSK